ncbi:TPT-domain-containing protein [Flagelloscypha sp. PMI_526]|nr:TPT-domain-containing protein [Flagelloscypha sp. PMI_526]
MQMDTITNQQSAWSRTDVKGGLPGTYRNDSIVDRLLAQARRSLQMVSRITLSSSLSGSTSAPLTRASPSSTSASNPVTFIVLCGLWYTSSALSSNTGKSILTQFRYPVTLTIVQFFFVAFYCLVFMSPVVRFSHLRKPTPAIIRNTLPMGMFQVGGHMFSSIAISRIPVSTVHTIKALSPAFTVAAYAILFGVSYSSETYISLLPLTIGVMLACSFDISASNITGLACAFGSALVFVSSNIFFKKIMPSHADPEHITHPKHEATHSVAYYFFMNGTVHFGQNIIAFIILSSTSPVTYSIASLIKRVVVILIAIAWFNQSVHPVQGFGIVLTFAGLWMYNNAKGSVEKGERQAQRVEAVREGLLPVTREDEKLMSGAMETTRVASGMDVSQFPPPRLTGRGRGASMSHHAQPPLHIKTTMPEPRTMATYPSPPPSSDSPPAHIVPLPGPPPIAVAS